MFIKELEVQGCRVTCVGGTVTDPADVQRAIGKCTNRLTGVVQMALNLQVCPPPLAMFIETHKLISI